MTKEEILATPHSYAFLCKVNNEYKLLKHYDASYYRQTAKPVHQKHIAFVQQWVRNTKQVIEVSEGLNFRIVYDFYATYNEDCYYQLQHNRSING